MVRVVMVALPRLVAVFALCLAVFGCETVNLPLNPPLRDRQNAPLARPSQTGADGVYIGLAFSGGGHRASAFSLGVLEELRATGRTASRPDGLAADVALLTAVSGGAVTAAWFGLTGPAGLDAFRDRYLIRDGARYMEDDPFGAETIRRGVSSGVNARDTFGRWLDEALFEGATFATLRGRSQSVVTINASDIASANAFVFGPDTFDALCSDLSRLPLSEAVAASAAFPIVFSPIQIAAHQADCDYTEPRWLRVARLAPDTHPALRAYAEALARYADPGQVQQVSLWDGGVTDSFGVTGFLAARARSGTPYAPMTEGQAVRTRRMLFLVVDSEVERDNRLVDLLAPAGRLFSLSVYGLTARYGDSGGGGDLDVVEAYRAIDANTEKGFDTMTAALTQWQGDLIDWRCALPPAAVAGLRGSLAGWDCRDLTLYVGKVSFSNLPPDLRTAMNAVPTRLSLPTDVIDMAIGAGRIATRATPAFAAFLDSLATGAP